ncbi:MAG: YkgJ family cysteine cluster protein [Pirellulales bacterium]
MSEFDRPLVRRKDLESVENLCEHCTAMCCRYFALPLDEPEGFEELEYLRWYLLHDRATVFTEDDTWYLLVHTECKHIQEDYRCGIYATRPLICREYTTKECEYDNDALYDRYFESPEQVYEYAEALFQPPYREGIRSPKPAMLPLVTL